MTLSQLLHILKARQRLMGLVLAAVVLLVVIITLIMPEKYVGAASVVVDAKGVDPVTGAAVPQQPAPSNIATQIDIITSHAVAARVVDRLKLTQNRRYIDKYQHATHGLFFTGDWVSLRDWIADKLLEKVDIDPAKDSNVITITFGDPDPVFAAAVANAFAEAYIQTNLELTADPASRQAVWFKDQLQQLRRALEVAQQTLAEHQRKVGVIASDGQLDVENAKLQDIASQLVTAQTSMYDADTRLAQMNRALEKHELSELPDVIGDTVLQGLKSDLSRAESNLAETAARYDHNHPQYQSAKAQVGSIQAKIAAEINTAKGAISQTAQIARKRAQELQVALEQQKSRILELKREHNDLDVLQKDVDSAQKAYDTTSQRATEVRMQGQLQQTDVAFLSAAVPPLHPSRPKPLLYIAIGAVLGLLLGAAAALRAEVLDRRIRSGSDLVLVCGIRLLGELPGPAATPFQKRWLRSSRRSTDAAAQAA